MKKLLGFLVLCVSCATSFAQTHFTNADKRTIEEMGAMGKGAIHIDKPLARFFEFTVSPSGRLMYIEDLDTTTHLSLQDTYIHYHGVRREAYLKNHKQPYNPERITRILHVTDPEGKDISEIAIQDKYGSLEYYSGYFLGDKLVLMEIIDRRGVINSATIINLEIKKIWTWEQMRDNTNIEQIGVSPDGGNFVVALKNGKTQHGLLFYNGIMLLPYYDAQPPMPADAPEIYFPRFEQFKAKLRADYPNGFCFNMDVKNMWSSDGRYLAVVQVPPSKTAAGVDTAPTSGTAVLLVDTAKAGPGMNYSQYSLRFPFSVPPAWASKEIEGQPPFLSTLKAKLDLTNQTIMVSSPRIDKAQNIIIPLPENLEAGP